MSEPKLGTLAVHAGEGETLSVPSTTTPVYQATTYRFESAADAAAYLDAPEGRWLYARLENPTVVAAERKIAALEGAEAAACFASGMAALTAALLASLRAGDALLLCDTIYGQTTRLARDVLERFGVEIRVVPFDGLAAAVAAAPPNARALVFESPTNPTLRVADVPAVAAACRARGHPRHPRRHLRLAGEPPRPSTRSGPGGPQHHQVPERPLRPPGRRGGRIPRARWTACSPCAAPPAGTWTPPPPTTSCAG